MKLELTPVNWKTACEFIRAQHSHHLPPQGWKFGVGVAADNVLVGVITVGRPVARYLDNGLTLEITRCCTDRTPHAASMLYGAAWRAVKAMGYKRLITYTLITETGTSLTAAGYKSLYVVLGRSWDCPSRPRIDKTEIVDRMLWEALAREATR
jgi:hypothetical protein